VTGLVIITQLQPIAVQFSLPQQQIVRVNAAADKGALAVDVFGNDGVTVIDTGTLKGIDNQVDPTTGTLKLKAEFPNDKFQLWPGQFVNVRLKVETIDKAIVVPTSAVQRGPAGTFSYVIGDGDIVTAKPVVVTQQNENDAVIASGLTTSDRVVTTGFANLSDGAKVLVGKDEQAPTADLAPRKRSRSPDGRGGQAKEGQAKNTEAKDSQAKDGQGKDGEHRGRRERGEGDHKGQAGSTPAGEQSGGAAKSQP
jgi:multidrug efflux system membrane fusion protein